MRMAEYYEETSEERGDQESALYEWQHMCWLEKTQPYQLDKIEANAYKEYIGGTLCGQDINTALIDTSINLLNGQINTSERNIPLLRRVRSRK